MSIVYQISSKSQAQISKKVKKIRRKRLLNFSDIFFRFPVNTIVWKLDKT
ncbi:hypothetical protein SMSK597_0146 [Streptococcus mitis SK597]|uniref:Uncharacterized protein n=1 Tax=Streptococcus mitis SK597 TaxID=585204 RepID=E1LQB3_STRMT|nr:hypothetical protein SMSK597_0146 [Streptococcus mitis SK597]